MRYVKIVVVLCLVFIGSVVGAQAKSEFVPTYEQTAEEVYAAYKESIVQQTYYFQNNLNVVKQKALSDIEANIADDVRTSKELVRKMIEEYKEDYIADINEEASQMRIDMLEGYAEEKKALIQEEITEDITTFLNESLTE